jgi:hypothetical protein
LLFFAHPLSPYLAQTFHDDIVRTMWVSTGLVAFATACCVALVVIDRRALSAALQVVTAPHVLTVH